MLLRMVLCLEKRPLMKTLVRLLENEDLDVECVEANRSSWQRIMRSCADIVAISERLIPAPIDDALGMLNQLPEAPTTVVFYDGNSPKVQAGLIAAGADLALNAGVSAENLRDAILSVVAARGQFSEKTYHGFFGVNQNVTAPRLSDFPVENKNMYIFMQEVRQVCKSDAPLLILGETGVGKEHLARAIHAESPRSGGPFVTVNMAALPDQLLESELFGHQQGAFTGAMRYRRGAFEQAHHGTIFLDEIGEMPQHLQVKLLRVLQDYHVKPLGGQKEIWVDVRVMAATNLNLEDAVQRGEFRKDLFFRISVISLNIPPLRSRREDIPFLVRRFLSERQRQGMPVLRVSSAATRALQTYGWPGNVRELFNVLERATILCRDDEDEILERHLPRTLRPDLSPETLLEQSASEEAWEGKDLKTVLDESIERVERRYLEYLLQKTNGRVGEAARLAEINARTLYNKLQKYGLRKEDFRAKTH